MPGDPFHQLLLLIHEAALDDSLWPKVARLINEVTQAKGHTLTFGRASDRRSEKELSFFQIFFGGDRREDLEKEYARVYWHDDVAIPRLKRLPEGEFVHFPDLYTDRERKTSPAFNEAHHHNQMQKGLGVALVGRGRSHMVWCLSDSVTSGGWNSVQIEIVSALLPHIRQFVRVRQTLADAEARESSLAELLDNGRCGVIQLDREGRIVEANEKASALLRHGEGLSDPDGVLKALHPTDNEKLQELLAGVLTPSSVPSCPGSMTVRRSATRTRLALHIHPVARSERHFPVNRVAALVLVVDPESRVRVDPQIVEAALGLTPAESRLAVMVATGYSLRTIAALTRRTEGTVRWHLKQIFRKQGISRQPDLVRRVLTLDGFPGSDR